MFPMRASTLDAETTGFMTANICTVRWAGWGVNGGTFQKFNIYSSPGPRAYNLRYHNPSKVMGPHCWQSLIDAAPPPPLRSWLVAWHWQSDW